MAALFAHESGEPGGKKRLEGSFERGVVARRVDHEEALGVGLGPLEEGPAHAFMPGHVFPLDAVENSSPVLNTAKRHLDRCVEEDREIRTQTVECPTLEGLDDRP